MSLWLSGQEKLNEEGSQEKGGPGKNVLTQRHVLFELYVNLGNIKMYQAFANRSKHHFTGIWRIIAWRHSFVSDGTFSFVGGKKDRTDWKTDIMLNAIDLQRSVRLSHGPWNEGGEKEAGNYEFDYIVGS